MAASAVSTGGLIDPTKQAEYPVVLGDKLAGKQSSSRSRLVNVNYNYKTKSATAQQRSTITRSLHARDLYNLTISDKAPNAENELTYSYKGSADPAHDPGSDEHNLVLVFDADRKVFVLESVSSQLNFNLRSAPAKTEKQVIEKYTQLRTLQEDEHQGPSDDREPDTIDGQDDGPADESNPYDFRHFLPKENADDDKSVSDFDHALSDTHSITSKAENPVPATAKSTPSAKPRSKQQTNPLRPKKRTVEPAKDIKKDTKKEPTKEPRKEPRKEHKPSTAKPAPKPPAPVEEEFEESRPSPSDTGSVALSSQKTVPSPGSNIIIDGDLIIDMGSPPPSRPAFNINPAHFSSNNTPANDAEDEDEGDEDMDDFRLPSPAGRTGQPAPSERVATAPAAASDDEDDDDLLAAEMEAAFEESAREEEQAKTHHYQPASHQYHVPSDDESEVSEEE